MIYLDNAATTRFKPFKVKLAALNEMNKSANPGRSSHAASMRAALTVEECREEIRTRFFDGNVVFTKNCTEALNLAIFGSDLKNQVITTSYEHNSVLRPLKYLADKGKIKLTILTPDNNGSIDNSLKEALKYPTSLVAVSAMSNISGSAFDIAKLASVIKNDSDAKILVDMAQAGGHIGVNLQNADMCAFAGHKSLHGIQGTGFLLLKRGVTLKARNLGGTGTSSLSIEHPNDIPDGMEAGTLNTVGIAALREGIKWTMDNFEKIKRKTDRLTKELYTGFKDISGLKIHACGNGIILCNFTKITSSDAADLLNSEYGICVRSGLHCAPLAHKTFGTLPYGAIRFSLGYNNNASDVDKCLVAMENIAVKYNM